MPRRRRRLGQAGRRNVIRLDKKFHIVPRGIGLVIGCATFPTWNSYPALFADLATGNPVIVKPHPAAILPLAITVKIAREVLAEAGFDADVVLLAADTPEAPIAPTLARHPAIALVDFTGSSAFGAWLREHVARQAGLHRGSRHQPHRHRLHRRLRGHVPEHRLLAVALQRPDVHRAAEHLRPAGRHRHRTRATRASTRSPPASPRRSTRCWPIPQRAAAVCGAIQNPATLERVADGAAPRPRRARQHPASPAEGARTATPLMLAVDGGGRGRLGRGTLRPDQLRGILRQCHGRDRSRHAPRRRRKGAITAALYAATTR